MSKAWINALSEGSKQEMLEWIVRLDTQNDKLRYACEYAIQSMQLNPDGHASARDMIKRTLKECEIGAA